MSTESEGGVLGGATRLGDGRSWITLPNLEVLKSDSDNFKFQTFRNYFGAYALAIIETYGESPYGRLAVTVRGLPASRSCGVAPSLTSSRAARPTTCELRGDSRLRSGAWRRSPQTTPRSSS